MKKALLLVLVVLAAGCTGGVPETPEQAREQAEGFLACGDASFEITSANWSGNTLTVALENDGSIDLRGFDVSAESVNGEITVDEDSLLPAGGTNTLTVTTIDEPDRVTIVSQQCSLARDSSSVSVE